MKGLDICREYYLAFGKPMLEEHFPHLLPHLAVGLVGSGSECFGYDDDLSRDHDFEVGFCLFLPSEETIDRHEAFALERAYAKLPKEFMGLCRASISPVGGSRHGVKRLSDFLLEKTGREDGALTLSDWFTLPEQALSEVVNGEIFYDGNGAFSAVREALAYLPEPVRRKKLAGNLLMMGQAGQYNYPRCMRRGDTAAASLTATEFVRHALHAAFLLGGTYMPYYKWAFRRLRELGELAPLAKPLEELISSPNDPASAERKAHLIEEVAAAITREARAQGLTNLAGEDSEAHAYAVNDSIREGDIRALHILCGI